jgi:hypothetical protein
MNIYAATFMVVINQSPFLIEMLFEYHNQNKTKTKTRYYKEKTSFWECFLFNKEKKKVLIIHVREKQTN